MKFKWTKEELGVAIIQLKHSGDNIPFKTDFEKALTKSIAKKLLVSFLQKVIDPKDKYSIKITDHESLVLHKALKHAVYINYSTSFLGNKILGEIDKQL